MRNRQVKWYLAKGIAAVLILLGTQAEARQSPASVKALGMGGASVAYAQDSLTPFYNPATAICTDDRWDIGIHARMQEKELYLYQRRLATLQSGRFNANGDWDAYGEFGINKHVNWCNNNFAFGVQYNNYDHLRTRYHTTLQDFAALDSTQQVKFDWRTEALTFTGAYSWNQCHTIGLGLNIYFSSLTVEGLDGLANATFTNDPANFNNRGTDSADGVGFTLGYYGHVCEDLWLGLSWSPKVSMGDFGRYRGLLADSSIDIPETWRVGAAYQYNPCTIIAADWEYRKYDRIDSLSNNFPGNSTAGFGPLFGTSSGPGFGWVDEWIFRLGVDMRINECLTGRVGYRHEHGPVRRNGQTGSALNTLTVESVENYLTLGMTYDIDQLSEFSGYGEFGLSETKKANYPNIQASPTAPRDFEAASVDLKERSWAFGFAYGRQF